MHRITRRQFGWGVMGGSLAALTFGRSHACPAVAPTPVLPLDAFGAPGDPAGAQAGAQAGDRFLAWLRSAGTARARPVRNLVWNFYDTEKKRGAWIYPMLSGKAVLWLVKRGQVNEAAAIAGSLMRWQQSSRQGMLARSYGAFPSKIEEEAGKWRAGDRYYSGDNLVILEGLVALHERTKDPELLNSAIGIGTWLTETMCAGHKSGLWVEDHAAPMWFVTGSGDFANEIHGTVEMLWMSALHRLGKVTGEGAYCRQAERAFQFYRGGQYASGAYLDRYDPGFPPVPYDPGRWKPYQAGQVISDNVLRSALGACKFGDSDGARKFFRWLKVEAGAIPAYLDLERGTHGFPPGEDVYYDVTSSGLHRSLALWLGERAAAAADAEFLKKSQDRSGAWFWGIRKGTLAPRMPELAPIAGFWATADLSAPG